MFADPVQRFRSVLYTEGGDDFYGVMRMSVLRRVAPYDSYHWSDRTFIAELALHGPFHNIPEYLYFRRDHPTRATRSQRGIRTRCAHLDPKRGQPLADTLLCGWSVSTCWVMSRPSGGHPSGRQTAGGA